MLTDTEGIVLRQIKTSYNRRMILLFSKKYGKISAGTSIQEKGRGKSSLALRPFTYGRYELFKNRDSYNINSADVLKSYYAIGEDVDKYMNAMFWNLPNTCSRKGFRHREFLIYCWIFLTCWRAGTGESEHWCWAIK